MPLTSAQISTLADMLTYCRPHGTNGDRLFREHFLLNLPGIESDEFENLHLVIGDDPSILWSSHTDTVHDHPGFQRVHVNRATQSIALAKYERKRRDRYAPTCLGADDTAGVFLMREMILRGVPGHYVFHYGEERGCIGSGSIAELTPERIEGARFAIALDRAGTADIVTTQLGSRCCSDLFADSLAAQLRTVDKRMSSARGVFTDTAEYTRIIPECTNLSVGYYMQHSDREWVSYAHLGRLLDALTVLDPSSLVCARDPHAIESVIRARFGEYPSRKRIADSPYLWDDDEDDAIGSVENLEWCDLCRGYALPETHAHYGSPRIHQCECSEEDRKFWRYLTNR